MRLNILIDAGFLFLLFFENFAAKTNGLVAFTLFDDFVKPFKSTAADKEDVFGVDLNKFLIRVFAPALRGNVGDRTFQNFQQCLLHTLARNVPCDGAVFALAGNLVDLIDINNTALRQGDVIIRRLNQA